MRKLVVIPVVSIVVGAGIAGGGIYAYRRYQAAQAPQAASIKDEGSVGINLQSASGSNRSVAIDGSDSGGSTIPIDDSSSSSGGNLSLSGGSSNKSTTSSTTSSTSTSTSSSADATKIFDPTTFGQYEVAKYKTAADAFFADVKLGTGVEVTSGSTVTVNYRGWLTNGTAFDDSYKRGSAFSFKLGQNSVIKGWEQGFSGMKVGGKRLLIVPPSAGYGSQDHSGIPANSILVFEVELLGVQ